MITINNLSLDFAGNIIFNNISLQVNKTDRIGLVGNNGFFVFLIFFHCVIGFYGIHRMKVRPSEDNPDSQFVAVPTTITPVGLELNPSAEPIEEPEKIK